MTVARVVGDEWDSHLLLLYREEAERQDSVALWIQRGLERDEKILYTQPLADTFLPGLSERGVDVTGALRRGQLFLLTLEDFYPPDGQAALVRGALDEGYPGVRLAAQADAALRHVTENEYEVTDRVLGELSRQLPVSVLCQCNTGRITADTLDMVIDSHPDAVRNSRVWLRRRGALVSAGGVMDLRSASPVTRWLQRTCEREGGAELAIDLSMLTFIDVAGCRALVTGTGVFRGEGGVVSLQGAKGRLREMLTLLALDRVPGMKVA